MRRASTSPIDARWLFDRGSANAAAVDGSIAYGEGRTVRSRGRRAGEEALSSTAAAAVSRDGVGSSAGDLLDAPGGVDIGERLGDGAAGRV